MLPSVCPPLSLDLFALSSELSLLIETVDIAKIIKMGSLHASQKWSFTENYKLHNFELLHTVQ